MSEERCDKPTCAICAKECGHVSCFIRRVLLHRITLLPSLFPRFALEPVDAIDETAGSMIVALPDRDLWDVFVPWNNVDPSPIPSTMLMFNKILLAVLPLRTEFSEIVALITREEIR